MLHLTPGENKGECGIPGEKKQENQQAVGLIRHAGLGNRADVFTKVKILQVALWRLLDPR